MVSKADEEFVPVEDQTSQDVKNPGNGRSAMEDEIEAYFPTPHKNTRTALGDSGVELDLYYPEYGIAVECNGIYWHSDGHPDNPKFQDYHQSKTNLCWSYSIRLIHIFDDKWKRHKNVVIDRLSDLLGQSSPEVFRGKDCETRKITEADSRIFFEQNHCLGYPDFEQFDEPYIHYGLFKDGYCVACAILKDVGPYIEVVRYATRVALDVIQGLRRLVSGLHGRIIRGWSDNCWDAPWDNVYVQSGFRRLRETEPRKWHVFDSYVGFTDSGYHDQRVRAFDFSNPVVLKFLDDYFGGCGRQIRDRGTGLNNDLLMSYIGCRSFYDAGGIEYELKVE